MQTLIRRMVAAQVVFGAVILMTGFSPSVTHAADDVTILSPATNGTVDLNGGMTVTIYAKFDNGYGPTSAKVISGDGATLYNNTETWTFTNHATYGFCYSATLTIPNADYTNLKIQVRGWKTILQNAGPPPTYTPVFSTANNTGVTVNK